MRTRPIAILLALGLTAAACSTGDGSAANPTEPTPTVTSPTPTADPDPVSLALAARLGPGGEVDLALAIDLFDVAFGIDLGGATGSLPEGVDGTIAIGALLEHWEELTPEQKTTASDAAVGGTVFARWDPTTGSTMDVLDAPQALRESGMLASIVPFGALQETTLPACGNAPSGWCAVGERNRVFIDTAIRSISEHLGRPLAIPVLFAFNATLPAFAGTSPVDAAGTRLVGPGESPGACLLTLGPAVNASGRPGQPTLENTLAHELFHCFQFTLVGFRISPLWAVEGSAEWVGTAIGEADAATRVRWSGWLRRPTEALFERSYDAFGFFELMEQAGIDPWTRFDSLLIAGWSRSSAAAYEAAVGVGRVVDIAALIATSRVRHPGFGSNWDTSGTAVTSDRNVTTMRVQLGTPVTLKPIPEVLGSTAYLLEPAGDIILLAGSVGVLDVGFEGGARMSSFTDSVNGAWCLRDSGCHCALPAAPLMQGSPGSVGLAFGRPLDALVKEPLVVAQVLTLEEFCGSIPPACSVLSAADAAATFGPGAAQTDQGSRCEYAFLDATGNGIVLVTLDLTPTNGLPDEQWRNTKFAGYTEHATSGPIGSRSRVLTLKSSSDGAVIDVIVDTLIPGDGIHVRVSVRPTLAFGGGAATTLAELLAAMAVGRLVP